MSDAKQLVDLKIGNKKVVVFSKSWCPYCTKAKKYLKMYKPDLFTDDEYEEVEIEGKQNCDQIQDYLGKVTGSRSVPRVFVKGKFIGGGDDVENLHKNGQLKALLSS